MLLLLLLLLKPTLEFVHLKLVLRLHIHDLRSADISYPESQLHLAPCGATSIQVLFLLKAFIWRLVTLWALQTHFASNISSDPPLGGVANSGKNTNSFWEDGQTV